MQIGVRDLCKSYAEAGRRLNVIAALQFDFPAAGSISIVGRSGVGKSTLLHLLGGLDRPDGGSIMYDGVDLAALPAEELSVFRGRHVGFVFQFHHLLPEFSAIENVAMPLVILGSAEKQAAERAEEVLLRVGLEDRLSHRPGQLSGGEQQRVAIARAIVTRPAVLLADEPTGNLDLNTAREVQDLLLEINGELNNIMIIVTHNLELARAVGVMFEMLPGGRLSRLPQQQ